MVIETQRRWGFRPASRGIGFGLTVVAAAVLALTGCAAGQHAQTVAQAPAIDGISADSGSVGIRDAGIAAPAGEPSYGTGQSAPLQLVLINNGTASDSLTSVTSPVATSVVLSLTGPLSGVSTGSVGSTTTAAAGSSAPSASAAGSSSATASRSASASGSRSASAARSTASPASPSASSSAVATSVPIKIAEHSSVRVGNGTTGPSVVLTGLTEALYPSQSVPVTLRFQSGAVIDTKLAVRLSAGDTGGPTVQIAPSGGG